MSSQDSAENEKGVLGTTANEKASLDAAEHEKSAAHLDPIKTRERVPGHDNYYEKNGLRTYGDDEDHDHEPPVRGKLRLNWKAGLS
jgi:hypothetical protein